MHDESATNSPMEGWYSIGSPSCFYKSIYWVVIVLVSLKEAKISYNPYMITQHSVAPTWRPPMVSTTVAWNPVKCLRYSIVKCGNSWPLITYKIGMIWWPALIIAIFWMQKKTWLNWSKLWSKSCPKGLQLSVLLACFPSIASSVWYQKIPKAFKINTDAGKTSVRVIVY